MVCAGCECLTAHTEAVQGVPQPVQGQESTPACQRALACVSLPRAGDTMGKELLQELNTTESTYSFPFRLPAGQGDSAHFKGFKGTLSRENHV